MPEDTPMEEIHVEVQKEMPSMKEAIQEKDKDTKTPNQPPTGRKTKYKSNHLKKKKKQLLFTEEAGREGTNLDKYC